MEQTNGVEVQSNIRRAVVRTSVLLALTAIITLAHLFAPSHEADSQIFHLIHILLRKLYLLPVILGAIWFGLRGGLILALLATLSYLPVILTQREGPWPENLNQWGELLSIWVVAALTGVLAQREKVVLLRLSRTFEGAVEALVAALDCREHDTGLHSRRVRVISLWLARKMRISPKECEILRQGALLHDIGKVGIPDHILLKPGALTPEEREIVNRHPVLGSEIASAIPDFEQAAAIIRHHHENYDGSGYPDGLAGERIPLGARIFAVADVLDALTSVRPYRIPQPFEEARQWIETQAGKQFDPSVVEALRSMDNQTWKNLDGGSVA